MPRTKHKPRRLRDDGWRPLDGIWLNLGPPPRLVGAAREAEIERLRVLWRAYGPALRAEGDYAWAEATFDPSIGGHDHG